MTTPLFSVGGLFSGLDTDTIIKQLMNAERIPITNMQARSATYKAKIDAWTSVSTKLSAVQTAADKLKKISDFGAFVKVTSSNEDAVSVSSTGGATPSSISFTVDNLATNHQLSGDTSFASPSSVLGAGTFTVTVGTEVHEFTTTSSTTLQQLATQITNSDAGVSASVISTDGTNYQLILTSKSSGTANEFTASGTQTGLGSFSIVQQAEDARLIVGSTNPLTITRSSNVISDLVPGVTVTLKEESATPVTVDVQRDLDGAVSAIKSYVDELNKALTSLNEMTKYDAATKKAGILQGDSAARELVTNLRSALSAVVPGLGGTYTSAPSVGITVQRDGTFLLNETDLREALDADFDSVARLFARSGEAADSRLDYFFATDDTKPGTYAVSITQAATQASVTGGNYQAPQPVDEVFTITSGSSTANVTVPRGSTLSEAIDAINTALSAAGIMTVRASDSSGSLSLTESRYGSGASFTVADDDEFNLNGTYTGSNVVGMINGQAATGSGQTLKSIAGDSMDLQILVTATQAEVAGAGGTLALGDFVYTQGLAGRMSSTIDLATSTDGSVDLASKRWQEQIDIVNDQIEAMEQRLEIRERNIRNQFTAMENALAKLSSQGNWLAAQFAAQ